MRRITITKHIFLLVGLLGFTATAQFTEVAKVVSEDREGRAEFGTSVAIHDEVAVIGASRENFASGAAYTYVKDTDGNWNFLQKLSAADSNEGAEYGGGAKINGNHLVVAAGRADVDGVIRAGALYVYENTNDAWELSTKLVASDYSGDAKMGMNPTSIAMQENIIVAGAPGENSWTGSVYVFTYDGTEWTEAQKITAPSPQISDAFGIGVAMAGDQLAIGANQFNGAKGGVLLYTKDASGQWVYDQTIEASNGVAQDYFGSSVSMTEDQMVVGAYGVEAEQGGAYVYEKNSEGIWEEVQILSGTPSTERVQYGWDTDIQKDYIVVTAPHIYGFENTETYLYKRSSTGTWEEEQRIQTSEGSEEDFYGWSVAMYENQLLVGAPRDDFDSNGDNEMGDAGAAYFFNNPTMLGGITTATEEASFAMYPNPANDVVTLESVSMPISSVRVYTIQGVLVSQHTASAQQVQIATASYSSGVYMVETTFDNGTQRVQKLIKE